MWLKLLTTVALVLGIVLLCLWPWLIHRQPHSPMAGFPPVPRLAFEYKAMVLGYSGVVFFSFVAAMCLAGLLLGKAREEYRRALTENLQDLMGDSLLKSSRSDRQ